MALGESATVNKMRIFAMSEPARIQVLLARTEAERFEAYCRRQGFKKSTLIARLVREHLEREDSDGARTIAETAKPGGAQ